MLFFSKVQMWSQTDSGDVCSPFQIKHSFWKVWDAVQNLKKSRMCGNIRIKSCFVNGGCPEQWNYKYAVSAFRLLVVSSHGLPVLTERDAERCGKRPSRGRTAEGHVSRVGGAKPEPIHVAVQWSETQKSWRSSSDTECFWFTNDEWLTINITVHLFLNVWLFF